MATCCAEVCFLRVKRDKNLTYHKFPVNDPKRMDKWLKLCAPDHFSKHTIKEHKLCSLHFSSSQYYLNPHEPHFRLVKDAVPFSPAPPQPVIANGSPSPEWIGPHDMPNHQQGIKEENLLIIVDVDMSTSC